MLAHPLFDLSGKAALVTGAASGLGLAIAETLAENGARVVLADLRREAAEDAAAALAARGLACEAEALDVGDATAVEAGIAGIAGKLGRLDIAFANAGISAGPGPFTEQGQLAAVAMERWRQVLDVNLTGVFATVRAAAQPMKRQGWGRIVVTASSAGFRADAMVGYAYVATKAAVINLVRQAAVELAPHGVNVNGIAPGPFLTNIGGGRMHDEATERSFAESLPIGRIGRPHEIKGAALLLASEASSYITGAILPVDGGAIAW